MLKTVLAAITALTISGASLAYAQSRRPQIAPRWRPTAEDAAAMTDARIAALRTGLKLSAEQEKLWPPVEAAIRALAKQRADRMMARADRARRQQRRRAARRAGADAPQRRRHDRDGCGAQATRGRGRAALQDLRRGPEASFRAAAADGPSGPGAVPAALGAAAAEASIVHEVAARFSPNDAPPHEAAGSARRLSLVPRNRDVCWTVGRGIAKSRPAWGSPSVARAHSSVGRAADS